MRILLTGGSGFVGSHVARVLLARGADVAVILRHPDSAHRLADVVERLTVIPGDLAKFKDIRSAICDFNPDAIVHLAWAGVKGRDHNSLIQTDNIGHSVALMRLAIEHGVGYFLGLGSSTLR